MPLGQIVQALRGNEFRYGIGPFSIRFHTHLADVAKLFHQLYGDCTVATDFAIADFHLSLQQPRGVRRWYRPQVRFVTDGYTPFAPFPRDTAFALFEWGLNWCVATHAHQYLMLHSAVVEKNGQALLLPAWPGAGKSTLCAALIHRGWRLFSDEFGLVRPGENQAIPFPRCIPLKNESISVIRAFAPEALIGPVFPKTRKGKVAHLKPPMESTERAHEKTPIGFVVFPHYTPEETARLKPLPKARAFMKLAGNSFNYELLGAEGFRTVASIIRDSECRLLHFGDLEKAVRMLDGLVG